mmetsp:Transcript_48157/g.120388  ORF Transcript_48157/g.120388 Transcript_48157/m.120388 type:complete len:220 (+) Transcript_48157:925-1584(+)
MMPLKPRPMCWRVLFQGRERESISAPSSPTPLKEISSTRSVLLAASALPRHSTPCTDMPLLPISSVSRHLLVLRAAARAVVPGSPTQFLDMSNVSRTELPRRFRASPVALLGHRFKFERHADHPASTPPMPASLSAADDPSGPSSPRGSVSLSDIAEPDEGVLEGGSDRRAFQLWLAALFRVGSSPWCGLFVLPALSASAPDLCRFNTNLSPFTRLAAS